MNHIKLNIRHIKRRFGFLFLWMVSAALLFFSTGLSAWGTTDLLEIPALKSNKNRFSLMMDVAKANIRVVAVGERGIILYSDNECAGWTQAEVPVSVTITAAYFSTAKKGWAVGHDSVILHTEDGGETWQKQIDGWKINELILANTNQMVQTKTELLESLDPGKDTEQIETLEFELDDLVYLVKDTEFVMNEGASRPFMDVWFKNEREGIVIGSFGMILRTKDGGQSWEPMLDRIENPYSNHLYKITQSGDALYIAGESNGEYGLLFRSDDLGETWISLESPYEGSLYGVAGNRDGTLIIAYGLRGKIFYSRDKGETWHPAKSKEELSLFDGTILSDGSIYLTGADGVLLRSLDNGKTFSRISFPLPFTTSLVEASNGDLIVGGVGAVLIPADRLKKL